jgi:hypothetical protein
VIRRLITRLPTPLAVLLAGCVESRTADWARLFLVCETAAQFLEHVLRAQAEFIDGLDRPRSWGHRMATIRSLTRQLQDHGLDPILSLDKEGEAAFGAWVKARNEWAHDNRAFSTRKSVSNDSISSLLSATFSPLCSAKLLLVKPVADGSQECELLQGLQGFYCPSTVSLQRSTWIIGTEPELLLWREDREAVRLQPYLRYRRGAGGENRIEFLSEVRDKVVNAYVDPLP